jgi:hypothetical protein
MSDGSGRRLAGHPLQRWLAVAGFTMVLGIVVTLLRTPAADGYEPSMYAPYPLSFWALVITAFVLGQLLILNGALSRDSSATHWRSGFLLVIVVTGILVFMPFVRGYPVYGRGDVLTHVGYVRTIQATGGAPFQNIYQNIHQVVLTLSYATGVEPIHVINAVAGVFSLFSIAASYTLVAAVFDRRRALKTLPFVLYVFVKAQQTESFAARASLAVVVIALLLYHPLTAVFLILVFLVHRVVTFVSTRGADSERSLSLSTVTSGNVMQLSVVVFLAWYYNFIGIILRFELVFQRLLDPGSSETKLDSYSSTVSEYSPALVDLAQVGLVKFGQMAALLGIGCVFVLSLGLLYLRRGRPATPYLLTFGFGFILFAALGGLFMFVDLIGGFGRPLMFAQYFGALAAGSVLYQCYSYVNWQSGVTAVATVALLALVVLAVFGLYYSPAGGESNHQVTDQDLTGAEWYLDGDLDTEPLDEQGIRMYRFEHALNGSESTNVQQEGTLPPPRFNYTVHSTLGASYNETHYYVLTEQARNFYPTVYPNYEQVWRYRPEDYARLSRDPTVSHVYDSGEFDIYRIEPAEGS